MFLFCKPEWYSGKADCQSARRKLFVNESLVQLLVYCPQFVVGDLSPVCRRMVLKCLLQTREQFANCCTSQNEKGFACSQMSGAENPLEDSKNK